MSVRRLFLLAVPMFLLAAAVCATGETAEAPGSGGAPARLAELGGGEWQLASLRWEGKEVALAPENRPTITVEGTGKVHGLATLNRYFGQMELGAGGEIHWAGPLGSTMMAGPEHLMEQEVRFLQTLQGARKATLRGGTLVLEDEGGENVLEFRR